LDGFRDRIVVASRTLVRGYDLAGGHLWTADRNGFRADPADLSPGPGRLAGRPATLPDGRLVAELSEPMSRGFYVFDPGARRVDRVSPPVGGLHRPLVAMPENRLVLLGPTERDAVEVWWTVIMVDLAGVLLWSHKLAAEPLALLASGGRVVAVSSPSPERWRQYHPWQDLSDTLFVACIGPAGERLWTWHPPMPLTWQPAIADDGTVYVAAPERLWALR
jgi:hypothetical protein